MAKARNDRRIGGLLMPAFPFFRHGLSASVGCALLSACAGSSPVAGTPFGNATAGVVPLHGNRTFYYTGTEQTFTVPAGVRRVTVVARGGAGAGIRHAGRGGRVYAEIPVRPGEHLYVFVGGAGSSENGGWNGGGAGAHGDYASGFGGGGASDVRQDGSGLANRILVAGGGGGQGASYDGFSGTGGKGGGSTGGRGGDAAGSSNYCGGYGGAGGTQSAGGRGGAGGVCDLGSGNPGQAGSFGFGGDGGQGEHGSGSGGGTCGGGGGGAGYYGGGGGGAGSTYNYYGGGGGGGGGGSSYIEPSAIKFHTWSGWKNATGDGLVVFSWQ
jgi:hypothetical protein